MKMSLKLAIAASVILFFASMYMAEDLYMSIDNLLFGGLILIWVLYFLFRKNIDAKSEE